MGGGDRVLIDPIDRVNITLMGETVPGGLAELTKAKDHQLVRIPEGVSYVDAAGLPCAYGSAMRMMYTNGCVSKGEKVLILGASGGVGVCCVQLAKLVGATVIVCASTEDKLNRLKELGADAGINYVEKDFVKEIYAMYGKPARRGAGRMNGVDVAVNFTGGDTWVKSMKVIRCTGRLLTCGATAGYDPVEDLRFIWTFELRIIGSNSWTKEDIEQLLKLVEEKKLKVAVDRTYSLEESKEAIQMIEDRKSFGKLVVTP
jgi:alcohol dehydrogenase